MRCKTLCSKPGCADTIPCPAHARVVEAWPSRPNRLPSHKRYPPNWASLRRVVLLEEPCCRVCGDTGQPTVDHIDNTLPEPMRNSRENLQRLCRKHNTRKSVAEAIKSRANGKAKSQSNRSDPIGRTGYTFSSRQRQIGRAHV